MMIPLRNGPRRQTIQLIRTVYSPERGRGAQTVVARLPASATTLPPRVSACLTADERAQVEDFFETRRKRHAVQLADYNAVHLSACADMMVLAASASGGLATVQAAAERAGIGTALRRLFTALYGDSVRVVVRRPALPRAKSG